MLTREEKCNVAYSCTFHFCLLTKCMELSLLVTPFAQRFLHNAWLYLKKQEMGPHSSRASTADSTTNSPVRPVCDPCLESSRGQQG